MAREMGLGQKAKTSHSAGARKLVPAGFSDGSQIEVRDDLLKQVLQQFKVAERIRTTPLRIDNPFGSMHRLNRVLLLRVPAFRAESACFRNRLSTVHAEFRLDASGRAARARRTGFCHRWSCFSQGIHHRLAHRYTCSQARANSRNSSALVCRGDGDRLSHLVLRVSFHVANHIHADSLVKNLLELIRQGEILNDEAVERESQLGKTRL